MSGACQHDGECSESCRWVGCRTVGETADAIRNMTVRGAPAIGIAAAYGMGMAAQEGALSPARERLGAVFNPGFDVTSGELIASSFTDRGEIDPVTEERIRQII